MIFIVNELFGSIWLFLHFWAKIFQVDSSILETSKSSSWKTQTLSSSLCLKVTRQGFFYFLGVYEKATMDKFTPFLYLVEKIIA